jgi:hypothetical protein
MRLTHEAINKHARLIICLYFSTKVLLILGGILLIYLGFRLFILGVTGEASLVLEANRVGAQLINATPGTIFAAFGAAILWRSVSKGVDIRAV